MRRHRGSGGRGGAAMHARRDGPAPIRKPMSPAATRPIPPESTRRYKQDRLRVWSETSAMKAMKRGRERV